MGNVGGNVDNGNGAGVQLRSFYGRVADFAVFDRALTPSEVSEVYNDPNGLEGNPGWFIYNNGDATENPISANDILIMLPFNTSNRERDAKVYESDCVTELNITSAAYAVTTTEPTSTEGDGFIQFDTSLTVDINKFNGTKYMKPFEDGTRGGYVEVCLETFLEIEDTYDLGKDADQKVNCVVDQILHFEFAEQI